MHFSNGILAILGSAVVAECGTLGNIQMTPNAGQMWGSPVLKRQANPTCLDKSVLSTASAKTGQESGTEGIKAGQAASDTDDSNFINFCEGQTITNGAQVLAGSCNPIPMGQIPAKTNMISAIITNPQPNQKLSAFVTFVASVQINHLQAGVFVNPTVAYYTAPQKLNSAGDIIGHCHVTIQDIGSLTTTSVPDPSTFAFFKGIDDAGDGKGGLKATITGGLPAGVYRICTMIAAANHQPVNMPIAQRGAQDDCTKFEVVDDGKGTPADVTTSAEAAAAATSAATGNNKGNKGNKSNKGKKGKKGKKGSKTGSDAGNATGNGNQIVTNGTMTGNGNSTIVGKGRRGKFGGARAADLQRHQRLY